MDEKQAEAASLVRSLLDVAPSMVFDFVRVQPDGTRAKVPVRVQLLRVDEDHQVLEDAQAYAKSRKEAPKEYGDLYREGQAVSLLCRALRKVEKRERNDGTSYYPPLFTNDQQLRQSMTAAELAQCLNFYEIVRSKYGAIEAFSEDDYARWVELLGDPLRGPFWASCMDSSHWPTMMLRMAADLISLRPSRSQNTSELDQENSDTGTGSFTELPEGSPAGSNVTLPTDHLITKDEAAEIAKRIYGNEKKLP
jgi:hypothetical protein